MQKKPGLSSYAANPEEAVDSLKTLLSDAVNVVPVEKRSETPVRLGVFLLYYYFKILNYSSSFSVWKF